MSDANHIHALMLPFEKELLPLPERAFLMRAEPSDAFDGPWRARLVCEQGFKPVCDRLTKAGYQAVARLEGRFPAGLVLLTKHKAENRANIARAWGLLEPGGLLVCSGANALGAGSQEREVEREVGLLDHLSKHQARTFWLRRPEGDAPLPETLRQWLAAGEAQPVGDSGFVARAGCFSPEHADPGSALLAECLPAAMAGRVADLGAGWGYLSVQAMRRCPEITGIDLYEAEAAALGDARTNIGCLAPEKAACASYSWQDVCAGLPEVAPYDWIISNPPFHEGGRADPAIGRAFIAAAWKSIRRRGKFLMVANQHLPYEAELRRRFREVDLVKLAGGYKVFLASNRHDRVAP
ncbi:16S RNA G1207 methylase RsmC [Candidatus Terasakiella magnetica]|nr:16S RNA G1207 methylase RsmC [Candidatus Terasakiella magnetica]